MSQGKLTLSLVFAVVPSLFAAACVETEEGLDDEDLGTESQELIKCTSWGCDANSPMMDAFAFHDLHEDGLPNSADLRLGYLIQSGATYKVRVNGAKLTGVPLAAGLPLLQGAALAGSYMQIHAPNGDVYRMHIKAVSNVTKMWVGNPDPVETYDLVYFNETYPTDPRPVCENAPGRYDAEGRFWLKPAESIIFTGDLYDARSLTVKADSHSESRGWFNIGCAGSSLAKLVLNRHATVSMDSTHLTSWKERQTMLKMYAGDVCGSGVASTQQGEPLHWQDKNGWRKLTGTEASNEGLWAYNGAICIDEHRLENDLVLWSWAEGQIKTGCTMTDGTVKIPPTCSSLFPAGLVPLPAGYILTANP
jgi:hypothetical protein